MISSHPTIPLLVHEDCMEGIHIDLSNQQESLSKIVANTAEMNTNLDTIANQQRDTQVIIDGVASDVGEIVANTASIKTSSANTATQLEIIQGDTTSIRNDTSSLSSSVGLPADAASANTVIGLLKSISNKL